jgi:N-methylhydantoinase A
MADVLRELTIGRGHDPRDFVLYAYGGAGPVHCAGFGSELGVGRIVIPATSMVQSAYGALASDIHHSAERSLLLRGGGGPLEPWQGIDPAVIEKEFSELDAKCLAALAADGIAAVDAQLVRSVDIRYRSQANELIIPFVDGTTDEAGVRDLIERFERAYEDTYGKGAGFRQAGIEITTFRVEATGRTHKPRLGRPANGNGDLRDAAQRPVYDPDRGGYVPTPVHQWTDLPADCLVAGPAVLEHPATTVYVAPDRRATVDRNGNLIITGREQSS